MSSSTGPSFHVLANKSLSTDSDTAAWLPTFFCLLLPLITKLCSPPLGSGFIKSPSVSILLSSSLCSPMLGHMTSSDVRPSLTEDRDGSPVTVSVPGLWKPNYQKEGWGRIAFPSKLHASFDSSFYAHSPVNTLASFHMFSVGILRKRKNIDLTTVASKLLLDPPVWLTSLFFNFEIGKDYTNDKPGTLMLFYVEQHIFRKRFLCI